MEKKPKIIIIENSDKELYKSLKDKFKDLKADFVSEGIEFSEILNNPEKTAFIIFNTDNNSIIGSTAEKIRSLEDFKNIPFLFYIDSEDSITFFEGYENGPVDYIFNPVNRVIERKKFAFYLSLFEKRKTHRIKKTEIYTVKDSDSGSESVLMLRNRIEKILESTKFSAISSIEKLVSMSGGDPVKSHNQKVLKFIDLVGQKMRLPETIVDPFKRAAVLHDCFKYLLAKTLNSNDTLTQEEREIVESYPYMLAELTELFDFFSNERSVLLFHHENYDGSGYPEGLRAAEIPLGARIFSVADAVVAMLSDRPYRKRMSLDDVKEELRKNSGKQFDPGIIDIFISILDEREDTEIFYE